MSTYHAARWFLTLALGWLLTTTAVEVSAQQYQPGPVLDPVQPGNIAEIFRRERAWAAAQAEQASSAPAYTSAPVEAPPATWDQRAKQAFKSGNYAQAAYNWRHGLVDDPQNGIQALLLAQAEFAAGNSNEAAGATQLGMILLPYQEWGLVVKGFRVLYPAGQAYTSQLRALEKACKENPSDPAAHFVLGYQYLYLGYPKHAAGELKKSLELDPDNQFADRLLAVATGAPVAAIQRMPAPRAATAASPGPAPAELPGPRD